MKKIIAAFTLSLVLTGCTFVKLNKNMNISVNGTGELIELPYETADFSSLELNIGAEVEFEVSDSCSVSITAQQDIHDILSVTVEDGLLKIETKDCVKANPKNVAVKLSSPSLNDMIINGAADIKIGSGLKTESFSLKLNGAGDVDIEGLEAQKMDVSINGAGDLSANLIGNAEVGVEVNGAGDITLEGTAAKVEARINGAGDINTSGLKCENVTRNIMGLCRHKKK